MERDGDVSPDWRTIYAEEPDEEAAAGEAEAPRRAGRRRCRPAPRPPRRPRPRAIGHAGRGHRRAEAQDRAPRAGQHDGHRAVRRTRRRATRSSPAQRKDLVESIAATGEAIKQDRPDDAAAVPRGVRRHQPELPGDVRARCSAAAGPASRCSTRTDLLESGIEIIAQPPGKRLQNVQLLSGGEKALTAIALMFAHLQVQAEPVLPARRNRRAARRREHRPVPRHAPRACRTQTQFILITHNRKTMEIADRLYGVTMEEPGVSKLISVRLN